MGTWLDFKQLRAATDFAVVLKHYGVELKLRRGEQHQGPCPLPSHQGENRSKSFSANIKRGVFRCFSCKAEGNQIDFVACMEGLEPRNGAHIRQAALILSETFHLQNADEKSREGPKGRCERKRVPKRRSEVAQQNAEQAVTCPAIVNAPLDFQLQKLDVEHSCLKERGFTAETILHFGLGYCSRGFLQERIAIPLHNDAGQLIGYAGRIVDNAKVTAENPKYRFPGTRLRDGKRYEFHKSLFLYNGFAIGSPVSDLVVVEGFPSVWWLWQHGFPNVVALMGDSCSERQAEIIVNRVRSNGRVWVMPDGDPAGEVCGQNVLKLVTPHRFTRWIRLRPGEQPTGCNGEEFSALLRGMEGGCDGRI